MAAINSVVDLAPKDGIALITVDSPPVNALSAEVRAGVDRALEQAMSDAAIKAIVILCAGRTFFAGADITEFGKPPKSPTLSDLLETMDRSQKPIIAAIHGTALGGGFEVALAAHYRIADPSAKVGLPEIKLGLLPGAGGTQRLPRLVGVEAALQVILSGDPVPAPKALDLGALDGLIEGDLRTGALEFARSVIAKGKAPTRTRDRSEKLAGAKGNEAPFEAARQAFARRYRGFEAWEAALASVRNAVELPFEQGLAEERAFFMKLVGGTQSRAQRHVFFAERQVSKVPDVAADEKTIPIRSVGVIGAGTMGGGIAMNFLNAGIPVTIVEMKQEALDRGVVTIRKNYEATAAKGRLTAADVEARIGRLTPSLSLDSLADCDLVIEAVFEMMDIKKDVFRKLDAIMKPGAILATNTSYLDIDEIAASTNRPEQVLGLHFFSPANVMRLLEIVRGAKTAKPVIATAMQLAKTIGKVGVLVGVCHGFVGNRMLAARQREANRLILEGTMPWDVDRVHQAFGMPMGPFQMGDLAGLDLGWSKDTNTNATIKDRLCAMDRRGQKTGAGFYDYDSQRKATPSSVTERLILDFAAEKGIARRKIEDQEILERTIYPMINEGAKILDEGIALRASDIDIVWINGYGWPVYRGGPMFYADTVGLSTIVERLQAYESSSDASFAPAPLLKRFAVEGKSFVG